MKTIEVKMTYDKSTKGTHVYKDHTLDTPVPTIYIKRSAFDGEIPNVIKLSVVDIT